MGAIAARLWMLLKAEQSLGLTSVPWRLRSAPATRRPDASGAPAAPAPARRGPSGAPVSAEETTSTPVETSSPATRPTPPVHPAMSLKQDAADQPLEDESLSVDERREVLRRLYEEQVKDCTKCRLCEGRTQVVFGEGSPTAELFFIGEGPGETEDQTGRPFVGRAGQLLTRMIEAMGLRRDQVYIANIVKCRPPENRAPLADEVQACTPYLIRQLEVIRPKVIVTLGLPATQFMLRTDKPMRAMRGTWHQWRGIQLMPTYHPSYVLRSYTPQVRGAVWSDLQKVMAELGLSGSKGI